MLRTCKFDHAFCVQLLSFTIFLGLVGGGAFLFVKSKTSSIGAGSGGNDNDDGGPLADARKIMDKYNK